MASAGLLKRSVQGFLAQALSAATASGMERRLHGPGHPGMIG
jgi:hypothetical protein